MKNLFKKLCLLGALMPALAMAGQDAANEIGSKVYIGAGIGVGKGYNNMGKPTTDMDPLLLTGAAATYNRIVGGVLQQISNFYQLNTMKSGWGDLGFAAAITAGYDCKLNKSPFVLGTFVSFGFCGTGYNAPYNVFQTIVLNGVADPFHGLTNADTAYANVKHKLLLKVGTRFGLIMGESKRFMASARIGFAVSKYNIRLESVNAPTNAATEPLLTWASVHHWHPGIFVGLGLDYKVSKNIGISLVSDLHFFKRKLYNFSEKFMCSPTQVRGAPPVLVHNGVDQTAGIKFKPSLVSLMASVNFEFPVCRPAAQ